MKILVIEDEPALRDSILDALEGLFFEGIGAENGIEGVKLAQQHLPDLIVCDIMMPEMDGYGVINALRQMPETTHIPFIFLSAKVDKSDIRQGMNLGAEDYLTKPFTISELNQAISTQLQKRERIDSTSHQKLDELRSNITRSLPHELRTPLQGILSLSEVLINQNDLMQPENRLEMLNEIHNSADRLSKLIQNFLLYAELELLAFDAERIEELQKIKTELPKQLITKIAIDKAQQLGRKDDLQLDLQNTVVNIPEENLSKIVEEIIDNALKFSPKDTPIYIDSVIDHQSFILSITNIGKGMTAEQIAKVGAYMQFERKLYEQQGSGLGLVIAKHLAELQGGELRIESILDKETRVRVILPRNDAVSNE